MGVGGGGDVLLCVGGWGYVLLHVCVCAGVSVGMPVFKLLWLFKCIVFTSVFHYKPNVYIMVIFDSL